MWEKNARGMRNRPEGSGSEFILPSPLFPLRKKAKKK